MNAEKLRLAEDAAKTRAWKGWGPYLSERQWGTVREDYSPYGTAWESVSHDMARSRAYRWERMASAGSVTRRRRCACPWHCGMVATRS